MKTLLFTGPKGLGLMLMAAGCLLLLTRGIYDKLAATRLARKEYNAILASGLIVPGAAAPKDRSLRTRLFTGPEGKVLRRAADAPADRSTSAAEPFGTSGLSMAERSASEEAQTDPQQDAALLLRRLLPSVKDPGPVLRAPLSDADAAYITDPLTEPFTAPKDPPSPFPAPLSDADGAYFTAPLKGDSK